VIATARRHQILIYLLPALALVVVVLFAPMVVMLALSTTQWVGIGTPTFVGLDNFAVLFGDPVFRRAVVNTLIWVLVGAAVHIPLCLLVALVMSRPMRGWKFFRTLFFLPNIISATALALLWYFVFHVTLGLLNAALEGVGLGELTRAWLIDPGTALAATVTPWTLYIGVGMVLFLAQMATIPREYYEAAELDGASRFTQDIMITIPLIRRAIALQIVFVVGYALRTFEYPFLMTNGGPANASTTLSLFIYKEMISAQQYGLSMAAGVVALVLGGVLTALVFGVLRRTGD
jgi:raffinose/stachyose/melibiose transport system permease protein